MNYENLYRHYNDPAALKAMSDLIGSFGISMSAKEIRDFLVLGELILEIDNTNDNLYPTLRQNIPFYAKEIYSKYGVRYSIKEMEIILTSGDKVIPVLAFLKAIQ